MTCSIFLAMSPQVLPVAAEQNGGGNNQPNLVPVVIWTLVLALATMLIFSLGYLYRRTRGEEDELIPKTIDPYYLQEGHADAHGTGERH